MTLGTRHSRAVVLALGTLGGSALVNCSLMTSLDDLAPPHDASVSDVSDAAPGFDAPATTDAGDAGVADAADSAVPPGTFIALQAGGTQLNVMSGAHVCAVGGIERAMYCWGANDHGQLGLGTTGNGTNSTDKTSPTKVPITSTGLTFTAVDEFALGPWHSCARIGAQLYCWGQRVSGAVGDGMFGADQTTPLNIMPFATPNIALGAGHTCMIGGKFGNLLCWGLNHSEQLGHGLATNGDMPCSPFFDMGNSYCAPSSSVAVINMGAVKISAGTLHTCAINAQTQVQCWGFNLERATGAQGNVLISGPSPITVETSPGTPLSMVTQLSSTGRHNCVIRSGNTVWCWGQNDAGQAGQTPVGGFPLATQVPNISASFVAVGERATCAILTPSTDVVCWGDDGFGQLGDGAKNSTFTPVAVKGPGGSGKLTGATSLALGYGFACALTADKNVWCWGHNDHGQLGDGSTTDRPFPVRVVQ